MKTREEMLKNGHSLDADSMIYSEQLVKAILSAPTEEQMKCKYCHEPFIPLYSETDTANGVIEQHKVFGVYADGKKLVGLKFPYCPHCGRKLGDE